MNYTKVNENILRTFFVLKNYPKMAITGELTYIAFQNYLEGYVDALGHCLGIDLKLKITQWVQKKVKQKSPIFWTTHISCYYNEKSEEERINILIEMTEEFFQENSKWYV